MFDLEEIKHLRHRSILPSETKLQNPAFNMSNLP